MLGGLISLGFHSGSVVDGDIYVALSATDYKTVIIVVVSGAR